MYHSWEKKERAATTPAGAGAVAAAVRARFLVQPDFGSRGLDDCKREMDWVGGGGDLPPPPARALGNIPINCKLDVHLEHAKTEALSGRKSGLATTASKGVGEQDDKL